MADDMEGFRPRYGQANVGYDMEAARQYPQPSQDDIIRIASMLAAGGVGAGLGGGYGALTAGLPSIPVGLASKLLTGHYLPGAAATIGAGSVIGGVAGGNIGVRVARDLRNERVRDAEGQPGGFYGRKRGLWDE